MTPIRDEEGSCPDVLALRRWCTRPAGHAERHRWEDIPKQFLTAIQSIQEVRTAAARSREAERELLDALILARLSGISESAITRARTPQWIIETNG